MTHPSQDWAALVNAGVLGTDRLGRHTPVLDAPWTLPIDSDADAAAGYLADAAVLASYEQAGRSFTAHPAGAVNPFEAEDRCCTPRAGEHLTLILFGDFEMLLDPWCAAAAARGVTAPAELTPTLLDRAAAIKDEAARDRLLAAAGQRGVWLAGLNPQWRRVAPIPPDADAASEAWQTGAGPERAVLLRSLRREAPDQASALVAETWESESAADRAAIVAAYEVGASAGDEAWLEARLDDRSKQVRVAAARLLATLDGSRFGGRMAERVRELVKFVPGGGLLRKKPPRVEYSAPDELDDAAQRDTLELKSGAGLGAKGALLKQLAALAPLAAWTVAGAGDWMNAAIASDWSDALIQGWIEASVQQRNPAWAELLLNRVCLQPPVAKDAAGEAWRAAGIDALMRTLAADAAQRTALDAVSDDGRRTPIDLADRVLAACDFPWGVALSQAVAAALGKRLAGKQAVYDPSLRKLLLIAATRLDSSMVDRIAEDWTRDRDHWSANFAQAVHHAIEAVRLRRDMLSALHESPPR